MQSGYNPIKKVFLNYNVDSVLCHEVGHQLTDLLDFDKNKEILYIWNSYTDNNLITEDLSQYAWYNNNKSPIREFIAEAFSEYECNEKPRALAKKIGKITEDLYQQKFGG